MGGRVLLAVTLACLSAGFVSAATDKVVCYHGSWSTYRSGNGQFTVSDIDPTLCTHLIYSFVGINTDGTIAILDETLEITKGNLAKFTALKEQNSNLKTLVAIGGWNEGSTKYSTVAASASLRATFIQSALELVQTYNFDGFDLDWEYPAQRGGSTSDVANYATLIKEFREVFDEHGLLLTAAVAAASSSVDLSYDVPSLSNISNANDAAIRGWIERGADPQKLALGLGFYGRSFTLSSSSNTALGAPTSGAGTSGPYTLEAGFLGYNEICEAQLEGGWTTVWDDEQKNPYTYKGDQWIGYDNVESITLKVEYAKSLNLSGVMIWSIETEDARGICGTKYPLLNAINSALGSTSVSNNESDSDEDAADEEEGTADDDTAAEDETSSDDDSVADETADDSASNNDSESASEDTDTSSLCTKAGYVRDPSDCNVFYYCMLVGSSYTPLRQQCSSSLYFDETSQTCNWPNLVSGC
ncbi:hypothetical protein NQ318_000968 [Aromia moschata]|uniref:chitinase n=1 Tax=Aromia moschata TaxID=1265417 RepID=A0AAV8ZF78_9CUCU|nr:hypothetical protein NQ318_000968 [Aromia moschata]